jgi:ATP-binding cassette subfamily B (MDR/TAP) protein 1
LGLAIINFLSTLVLNHAFALAGARLTKRLRIKMFTSMLRQEIGFHDLDENRSSILSTQLAASAPFCKGLSSDKLGLLSQGIAGVGFSLIAALVFNWKLALFMLIFVPFVFGSGVLTGKASTNTKVNGKFSIEEGGRLTIETVENIKTVISLGREKFFIDEFDRIFNYKFKKTLAVLHIQAFFYSLSNSFLFFIQASAFSFGYYLIKYDNLTVTNLYRIYATMTFSSMILGRVYSQIPDQKKAKDAAKTAYKIINRKSKIDSLSEEGIKPDRVIGEIEFNNVHFRYPTRPAIQILNGLNLKINKNTTNALVGSSGCGKSTTISLLLRFYDVESGSITLDGVDIRNLNINWLRSKIGLVSQEPTLFNTTIKENICYGDVTRNDVNLIF